MAIVQDLAGREHGSIRPFFSGLGFRARGFRIGLQLAAGTNPEPRGRTRVLL
jgi:hypothetical protein